MNKIFTLTIILLAFISKTYSFDNNIKGFLLDISLGGEIGYLKEKFGNAKKGDEYTAFKLDFGIGYGFTKNLAITSGIEGRWLGNTPHLVSNKYQNGNYMSINIGDFYIGILYKNENGFIYKAKFLSTTIGHGEPEGTTFANGSDAFTGNGVELSLDKEIWKHLYLGAFIRFIITDPDLETDNILYNYGLGFNIGWIFY
ncbi:hypothetical protein [Persephonella sp.]